MAEIDRPPTNGSTLWAVWGVLVLLAMAVMVMN